MIQVGHMLSTAEGRAAVIAVYAMLLIGIILMPRRLLGPGKQPVPLWKNTRFWAVLICAIQIMVYGLIR